MEATHADESHIWWLISRLRTDADLEPSIWLSCNPDPSSYLFDWVKWWLYDENHPNYGLPDPEKNGKIRWIVRREGVIFWGDSEEEMIEKYGNPELPKDHPDQVRPLSFQVLLGNIYDNPPLMKAQPQYKAMLEALPDVERRRLLMGDWTAVEANSTYFLRTWCQEATTEPPKSEIVKTVRAYDLAGELKSDSNPSPDYSACVKVSKLRDGTYFIHDIRRCRIRFGDWKKWIVENALQDGKDVDVVLEMMPNPAAKAATQMLARELSEHGLYVRTLKSTTSKLDRFRPFSSCAMNGGVTFLKNCGYDLENGIQSDLRFVYAEMENFNGQRKSGERGHDDIVDSLGCAFSVLAQKINLPNLLGGLTSGSVTTKSTLPFSS